MDQEKDIGVIIDSNLLILLPQSFIHLCKSLVRIVIWTMPAQSGAHINKHIEAPGNVQKRATRQLLILSKLPY